MKSSEAARQIFLQAIVRYPASAVALSAQSALLSREWEYNQDPFRVLLEEGDATLTELAGIANRSHRSIRERVRETPIREVTPGEIRLILAAAHLMYGDMTSLSEDALRDILLRYPRSPEGESTYIAFVRETYLPSLNSLF